MHHESLAACFSGLRFRARPLMLHMCNTDRKSWTPVAEQLATAGISALTIDNRGFGESGGPRQQDASPEVQRQIADKWPGYFDTAFAWLLSQPGVDKSRIGAGGGSCGVNNAVRAEALAAEQKCMELLPNDKPNDQFKAQLRQAAEEKIVRLKGSKNGH